MLNQDQCWDALVRREPNLDGQFFVGVLSTGVYCRPSCPARRPLRKNVRFYRDPNDAERDGLRACLRCRPLALVDRDPNADRIRDACRYIEAHATEGELSLDHLAQRAGLSRFHFQRSFQAIAGVSPRAYVEACRLEQLKSALKDGPDVTAAIYDAGFGSASRVYEKATSKLGMTPKQYREGGANQVISYAAFGYDAPGKQGRRVMIAATDRGICFVQFGESDAALRAALEQEYPNALLQAMRDPAPKAFDGWIEALKEHLAGRRPHLDLPLDIRATAFQTLVWTYLQSIPYGETRSYAQVAAELGKPTASRAVASACARNTVALLIPCHRVIRGSGALGGYRWGLPLKQRLLDRESDPAAAAR